MVQPPKWPPREMGRADVPPRRHTGTTAGPFLGTGRDRLWAYFPLPSHAEGAGSQGLDPRGWIPGTGSQGLDPSAWIPGHTAVPHIPPAESTAAPSQGRAGQRLCKGRRVSAAAPLVLGPCGCCHTWPGLRAGLAMAATETTPCWPRLLQTLVPEQWMLQS